MPKVYSVQLRGHAASGLTKKKYQNQMLPKQPHSPLLCPAL